MNLPPVNQNQVLKLHTSTVVVLVHGGLKHWSACHIVSEWSCLRWVGFCQYKSAEQSCKFSSNNHIHSTPPAAGHNLDEKHPVQQVMTEVLCLLNGHSLYKHCDPSSWSCQTKRNLLDTIWQPVQPTLETMTTGADDISLPQTREAVGSKRMGSALRPTTLEFFCDVDPTTFWARALTTMFFATCGCQTSCTCKNVLPALNPSKSCKGKSIRMLSEISSHWANKSKLVCVWSMFLSRTQRTPTSVWKAVKTFPLDLGVLYVRTNPFRHPQQHHSLAPKVMTPCRTEKVDFSKKIKKQKQKQNHQKNKSTGRITKKTKKARKKQKKQKKSKLQKMQVLIFLFFLWLTFKTYCPGQEQGHVIITVPLFLRVLKMVHA